MHGTAHLFAGEAGVQLTRFLRNLVLARLLTPEDFGVATTFALILTSLEYMSDLSLEKLIVRDPDGNNEEMMAAITLLSIARFALLALAVFLSADWLADIFDVPDAAGAYRLFALVPIIRCFIHLDMFRVQRELNFRIQVYANILSQIIGLIVAGVLAWITRDYTSVVWGTIVQTLALVGFTHWMAERPFRASWHKDYMTRALIFGWPLIVNGLVLMMVSMADRMLVGAAMGMRELAIYTIAVLLVTVAGSSLSRIVGNVSLPWLSVKQEEPVAFQNRYTQLGHTIGLIAVLFFVPITLLGSDVIGLVFGTEYLGASILVAILSTGMAVKFMRNLFVSGFLAGGRTKDLMLSETARVVGIILAAIVLYMGGNLVQVGLSTAFGEFVAYAFCFARMRKGPSPVETHLSVIWPPVLFLLIAVLVQLLIPDALALRFGTACLLVAGYIGWRVATEPDVLVIAKDLLSRLPGRNPA